MATLTPGTAPPVATSVTVTVWVTRLLMVMEPEPVLSTSLAVIAVVPLVRLRVTAPFEVFLTSMVLPEKVQSERV